MAVKKRGKKWHFKIRVFGKEVGVATDARLKSEAEEIEKDVKRACRSGDYGSLDADSREVCIRMFRNQRWELPSGLVLEEGVREELTLWKSIELCLTYPDVRTSENRERLTQCFLHLAKRFGKDLPVKSIWIPQIKEYQMGRLNEGAAPSTINKEKSALSKMFQVLIELQHHDDNPARMVKNLSEKSGEREVYIGFDNFVGILEQLPSWVRPIVLTAFYSGMRRGEILGLRRQHVNLETRIILLKPEDVKEGKWKRVPIHMDLVPILSDAMKVQALGNDKIFLVDGHTLNPDSIRKPWNKAVKAVGLDPVPIFHDLRATWKTNAMRSGMDQEIRERIMEHYNRAMNVNERYGRISDSDLIRAIDGVTFDHGKSEIILASKKRNRQSAAITLPAKAGTKWEQKPLCSSLGGNC
ncbi:MAG: tyrosine-type recombinase/integrase [Desulfomonilaceae bacterium]